MKHSEFAQLVERYRRYDNRALVVTLAESYGRRDNAFASAGRIRNLLSALGLNSDYQNELLSGQSSHVFYGMKLGLELYLKYSLFNYEYENERIHALRDVMESRNFHMEQYCCDDFPVPDNWDMLDKSNPEYPPIDIEGVTK